MRSAPEKGRDRTTAPQAGHLIVGEGEMSINNFNDAMDAMRRPGSRLVQTNYNGQAEFWIPPSYRVASSIPKQSFTIRKSSAERTRCFQDIIKRAGAG